MQIQPTNQSFNGIYKYTKLTSYGKCIHGTNRGFDYDVFVAEDKHTGDIKHKLYYVTKDNKFIKSALRFFNKNKAYKELRGQAKWLKNYY